VATAGTRAWAKGKAPKGKIAHEALFEVLGEKGIVRQPAYSARQEMRQNP
jgi:hypothetical protein